MAHTTSRIAVLASGEGTTVEAFIEAGVAGTIDCQVALVVCNNQKAGVFKRIDRLNQDHGLHIQTELINGSTHPAKAHEIVEPGEQTAAEETAILELLEKGNYDLVVLMGYMKLVGPKLVNRFGWRPEYTSPYQAMLLNTHPGLLPETKSSYGLLVQEYVLKQHLPYGGQTLHVVAEEYDAGPVIAEHKVTVQPDDTPDSLFDRIRKAEKEFLPGDVDAFIKKRREYLEHEEVV